LTGQRHASSMDVLPKTNHMRITRSGILVIVLLFTTVSAPLAFAGEPASKIHIDQDNLAKLSPADQDRVLCIAERLETITAMDRSALSREERKALRMETRELKREAELFNRDGTVIYFSAGTLIIILLLILILT
jgi:hypothetical protein